MFLFEFRVQLDRISKSPIWHSIHTAYEQFKLPHDTTLIKGTSHEGQCTFSESSRLQFDGYPRNVISADCTHKAIIKGTSH
jgi:hypothetical protein